MSWSAGWLCPVQAFMQILSLVIRQEAERQQMVRCGRAVNLEKSVKAEDRRGILTWKESLAGLRGAMGLSVLQKWMVDGRGLGVNNTGVWEGKENKQGLHFI